MRKQRCWSIVSSHQIRPVTTSTCTDCHFAWQKLNYHLVFTVSASEHAFVEFFFQQEKWRKLSSALTISISTSLVWIPSEPNPWPFPLSPSLAPALMPPSILPGTRWPVNFASPLRPGYRPCQLTSEEKRTQDAKLPLITGHPPGGVLYCRKADTSQYCQIKCLSCCILSYYLWLVSLRGHFVATKARITWTDKSEKMIEYQTS